MGELLEKILEALFAEALAGVLVDSAKGAPTRVVAKIRGFRGWRKVVLNKTEHVFASENTIIIKKTGLWHWYSHPTKTVTFID